MVKNTTTFFKPWETIHESNPQEILERREKVTLAPLLIMQGALDDNVLPAVQEKFAATYKAAGGDCQFQVFEGCEHEWVATPGPQTDRARRDGQGVHRAAVEGVVTMTGDQSPRLHARGTRGAGRIRGVAGAWMGRRLQARSSRCAARSSS